jgi:tRNA (5-methylaminomethyl-2-thiouridylate)-methyltransferase
MKIAVLLSGGVDSSVALRLLQDQGHTVEVFYLKIWLEDELAYLGSCPWEEDLGFVDAVCKQAGVPYHVVPLQKEYWDNVVAYTIAEVKAGRTPSPDIFCNQRIKFGSFFSKVDASFEKIATGHYATVEQQGDEWVLKRAKDPVKDQTYFLSHLNQAQLSRLIFPLGNLYKSEVRELACRYNLSNQNRKDSQGICFLGKIAFSDFIKHHLGTRQGDLVEYETGVVVGTHEGYWYYTIGQRKGLGLSGGPWFVVRKDVEKNIVYISRNYYSDDKQRNVCSIEAINWISGKATEKRDIQVKVRHGEKMYVGTFQPSGTHTGVITINDNDQGLAPGQFAVLYDADICLGSGVITEQH